MSNLSQAEMEQQYHLRLAQVLRNEISPEQAFSNVEDWTIQLGKRKAFLHPNMNLWFWYDRLHDYWVPTGCGVGEVILLVLGTVGAIKKLADPGQVDGWCMYMLGEELNGPIRVPDLIEQFKTQAGLSSIMVWSPLAVGWLSVSRRGDELSFCDKDGNPVSIFPKVTAPSAPAQVSTPAPAAEPAPAPAPASLAAEVTKVMSRPSLFEIVVLSGERENQHFPILERMRLGRENSNDLVLPDRMASRRHAVIQRQGAYFQIEDLKSDSGTFVNDQPINAPVPLKEGDIVLIGETRLKFTRRT